MVSKNINSTTLLIGILLLLIPLWLFLSKTPSTKTVPKTKQATTTSQNNNNKPFTAAASFKLPTFQVDESSPSPRGSSSSSICPPFSTSEGAWGLNNPYFNSIEYLSSSAKTQQEQQEFGKWIFGSRKYSRRTKIAEQQLAKADQNDQSTSKELVLKQDFITLEKLCRQKTSRLQFSQCDWDHPEKFTPFAGIGKDYDLDESVAIFKSFASSETTTLSWCYDFVSPLACLQDKTIVLFGDSHIRNIAQILCRMMVKFLKREDKWFERGHCAKLDTHFDGKLSQVYLPRANCTLAYLRVRYNLQEQLETRFLPSSLSKTNQNKNNEDLIRNADVVVYGRGLWDIVMADKPRRKTVLKDFESDVLFLAKTVFWRPHQRIVIKLPHYVHYEHKDHLSLFNLRLCANWKRQTEERDAVICGLSRAMKKLINSDGENIHNSNKISILDDFGSTKQIPVLNGTDHHGHHYEGTIGESLVQHFLNVVCPVTNFDEKSNNKKIFQEFMTTSFHDQFAKLSCDRLMMESNGSEGVDAAPIEKCSCGTAENVVSTEGKEYCEELKKRNIEAPFIVNE